MTVNPKQNNQTVKNELDWDQIINKFKNKEYTHKEFLELKSAAANWITCPVGVELGIKINDHAHVKEKYGEDVLYWGGKFARDFSEINIDGTVQTFEKLKAILTDRRHGSG